MGHAQTTSELTREALVALLAHRFLIILVKLGLLVHFGIANGARKVMNTPGLVQRGEYVATNDLIADEAEIAKQLMIVRLAVGQTTFFIMTVSQKWFLAFSTDEMLNMPMLA